MASNLGDAKGRILLDASGVRAAMREAQSAARSGFADIAGSIRGVGQQMTSFGRDLTLATAPITAFLAQGVLAFADFDQVLTEIQARTGATAEQMELVRSTALEMGRTTSFSATSASEAMLQMLASGYDLTQTMAALPDVLNLAAASGMDLGFTADTVTDLLAIYNLEAEQSRIVTDALAQASGASSAEVDDLAQSFIKAGPAAKQFGLDVNKTAAAFAVLAEAGIKGPEAGTQFSSLLQQLSSDVGQKALAEIGVALFDAQGNARDFETVIDEIDAALEDATDEDKIRLIHDLAGAYGDTALNAFLAADGLNTMEASMAQQADAATLAASMMNSLKGVFNQVRSAVTTLSIVALGPLVNNYLKPFLVEAALVLNMITAWMIANPELAETLMLVLTVVAGLGPIITILGYAVTAVGVAFGLLLSPLYLVIIGLTALGAAYRTNLYGFRDAINEVADRLEPFADQAWQALMSVGDAIAGGTWQGIKNGWNTVVNGTLGLFYDLLDQVKAYLGIASPSQLFADEVGRWIPEGIAEGLKNIAPIVAAVTAIAAPLLSLLLPVYNAFGMLTTILKVAGVAFSFINPPLLILVGLLAALGVAYKTNFLGFADGVKKAAGVVSQAFKLVTGSIRNVIDAFKSGGLREGIQQAGIEAGVLFEAVREGVTNAFESVQRFFEEEVPRIVSRLPRLFEQFKTQGSAIWAWIRESLPAAAEQLGFVIGEITVFVAKLVAGITALLVQHGPEITDALGDILYAITVWALTVAVPELAGLAFDVMRGFVAGLIRGLDDEQFNREFQKFLDGAEATAREGLASVVQAIADGVAQASEASRDLLAGIVAVIAAIVQRASEGARNLLVGIVGVVAAVVERASEGARNLLVGALAFVQAILEQARISALMLLAIFFGLLLQASMWITNAKEQAIIKLGEFWNTIQTSFTGMAEQLGIIVVALKDNAVKWLTDALVDLVIKLGAFWDTIKASVTGMAAALLIEAVALKNNIVQWLTDAQVDLVVKLGAFWDTLKASVQGMATAVKTEAMAIGTAIVDGVRQGINDGWGALESFFTDKLNDLKNSATDFFGIHSPSRVFADEIGKMIPAGIKMGMDENMQMALRSMAEMGQGMTDGFNPRLGAMATGAAAGSAGGGQGNVTNYYGDINLPAGSMPPSDNPQQQAKDFFAALKQENRRRGGGMVGANA